MLKASRWPVSDPSVSPTNPPPLIISLPQITATYSDIAGCVGPDPTLMFFDIPTSPARIPTSLFKQITEGVELALD